MEKNVLGIIAAIVSVAGLALVSSWWCLFPLGIGFTLAVVGFFGSKGKDKSMPFIAMLVAAAGILVMCQFAGFIPTIGFKAIGVESGLFDKEAKEKAKELSDETLDELGDAYDAVSDTLDNLEGVVNEETGSSSSNGGSGGSDDFIGSWNYMLNGHMIAMNFYEDGKGIMQSDSGVAELEWEKHGRTLTIRYLDASGAVAETEEVDYEVNGDELIMVQQATGSKNVLNKMY